jgi:hypothetical protein
MNKGVREMCFLCSWWGRCFNYVFIRWKIYFFGSFDSTGVLPLCKVKLFSSHDPLPRCVLAHLSPSLPELVLENKVIHSLLTIFLPFHPPLSLVIMNVCSIVSCVCVYLYKCCMVRADNLRFKVFHCQLAICVNYCVPHHVLHHL